jgi:predicted dehydrogenase
LTVSVGLIGCGAWGKLILRDLVSLGARVHVVVREASPEKLNAPGAVSVSVDAALIPQPVDGFIVATPTSTHAAVIEKLLPTGKSIFVEKPLTSGLHSARRLVAIAGDRIFVMDKWRYHPGVEALRDQARSGALGEIRAVRTFRVGWGTSHADVDAIWTLLPHDLAIAYEVLGALPKAHSAWSLVPGRVEFGLMARLADGTGGPEVFSEISTCHPQTRRSVVVIGERGAAELADSYADRILVVLSPARGPLRQPDAIPVSTEMPLRREIEAFLRFLQGGPPPRSSAAEGLLVVERIAALRAMAGLAP